MASKKVGTLPKQISGQTIKHVDIQNVKPQKLTKLERQARRELRQSRTANSMGMGGVGGGPNAGPASIRGADSGFFSPQLSTDFLELPQSDREKRELFRFYYLTNEIVGSAIDSHTDIPLSKIRLSIPKGKDPKRNRQVLHFFEGMCKRMKLFQGLYDATHSYWLFGGCVTSDTPIKTKLGIKSANTVKVGDELLTHLGRWRRVLRQACRYSYNNFSIDVWKNYLPLKVSEEHPIEVLQDEKFVFKRADQITKRDFVRITWPTEIKDVDTISLVDEISPVQITNEGYFVRRSFMFKRPGQALKARKALLNWLSSLSKPVLMSRIELAKKLDVKYMTLNNIIYQLHSEISTKFHKKIGNEIQWIPTNFESNDNYKIDRDIHHPHPTTLDVNDDLLYLIGYWLGDGTISRDRSRPKCWGRGRWSLAFGKGSEKHQERIEKIINSKFGPGSYYIKHGKNSNSLCIDKHPLFLEWWAKNFGETSHFRNLKRIPEWVMNLPKEKQIALLGGLTDSDGCISQIKATKLGIFTISLTSKSLIESIRDVCFRIGAVVSYQFRKDRMNTTYTRNKIGRSIYTLNTNDKESILIITAKSNKKEKINNSFKFSKPKFHKWVGDKLAFKVHFIKSIEAQPVFNFEVEEDHTYQAAFVSTHNCHLFAEDQDIKVPEELIADMKEEEVGEIDYAGRPQRKLEVRLEPKPEHEQVEAIRKYVQEHYQGWQNLRILPSDQIRMEVFSYTDMVKMELVPAEKDRMIVMKAKEGDLEALKIAESIPEEIRSHIESGQPIPLNTSPYDDYFCSSFCYYLAHKRLATDDKGVSLLERCLRTLTIYEKLRQAQTSIASRAMTPKRVVWGEKMSVIDVEDLRDQVDQALIDPDFSIITNFEVHWDEIGARDRLLDLSTEYEQINKRLYAGLRTTESILTGESSYSGERIHLDVMNTMYLGYRERLVEYVEEYLFAPVAEKKGFFEIDEDGNRVLLYPKVKFTRLALRDNTELQDFMFNLYSKNSLPIEYIYDLINVDVDDATAKLEKDMFTVRDSIFNEAVRRVYEGVAEKLISDTDVVEKIIKSMNLKTNENKGDRFASEK